jgi:hypothetical protein
MRTHYWSCSKFADWLRGTMKPKAETGEGWELWRIEAEKKYPYRYWLAEEGLDILQKTVMFIPDIIYDCKYAFINRFVTKTHTLTSNLKRWKWHEMDERMLHCLFDELVNFVEVELAAANFRFDEEARNKFKVPFWGTGWFRTRTYRNALAGREYLDWARKLKMDETWALEPGDEGYGELTSQAKSAQEVLELYLWWTLGRPLRKDPYDESGWTEYCARRRSEKDNLVWNDWENRTEEDKAEGSAILEKLREIEKKYEDEDEAMLIRLIKVRKYLWT